MSQSMQGAAATAAMTLVEKLEILGHQALDWTEHAAIRLVGECAEATTALQNVERSSPLFLAVCEAGKASAIAHGIPIVPIEDEFTAVMAKAQQFVAGLKQPAPSAPLAA